MKSTRIPLLIILVLSTGISISPTLLAQPDSREDGHHMGHHDGSGWHHMWNDDGVHHGYGHMYGARWRQSLTDAQRSKIEKLELQKVKKKADLKARKKTLKTELALMATKDGAKMSEINKKIDQLMKLKKQMMRLKYEYILAVRKELTEDQKVSFDLAVMRKARRGSVRR